MNERERIPELAPGIPWVCMHCGLVRADASTICPSRSDGIHVASLLAQGERPSEGEREKQIREKLEKARDMVTDWRSPGGEKRTVGSLIIHRDLCEVLALLSQAPEHRHDCENWSMEGIACARCNPIARELREKFGDLDNRDAQAPEQGERIEAEIHNEELSNMEMNLTTKVHLMRPIIGTPNFTRVTLIIHRESMEKMLESAVRPTDEEG